MAARYAGHVYLFQMSSRTKVFIENALYRYCNDTMAVVMIWEFWGNEIGLFK
jgi:hypothetical protein